MSNFFYEEFDTFCAITDQKTERFRETGYSLPVDPTGAEGSYGP